MSSVTEVRLAWVDWAKFLGIALVVYAHIPYAKLGGLVFLFHMPFFFLISGYLYKKRPFKEELRRTIKCLYLPYLCYNVLLLIFTPPQPPQFVARLEISIYVLFGNQEMLPEHFRAMWFLVSLMLMRLISSFFHKRLLVVSVLAMVTSIVFIKTGLFTEGSDFFQLKTTMICYQFFVIGNLYRENPQFDILKNKHPRLIYSITIMGSLFLLLIGWIFVGSVNLFRGNTGNNLIIMLIVAYGLSYFLIKIIETSLPVSNKIIQLISIGTLFIVCLHQSMLELIDGVLLKDTIITPVIITIIVLLLSYPIIVLFEKYCPFLLGKSRKK